MQKFLVFAALASLVALAMPSAFERYRARMLAGQPEMLDRATPVVEAKAEPPQPETPTGAGSCA